MANLIAGESLRVLLVSSHESLRDEVGEALAGRAGDHRLFWVAQADLAPTRAQDLLPHVILVDDELEDANPVTLTGLLSARLPTSIVLALLAPEAMGLARQLVLAGARAFLTKPVQPDDLMAVLRQVLAARHPAGGESTASDTPPGRVVVFCAPKGGTGRTTMAINTAIMLAGRARQSTVLVDADYAAPALDVALNLRADRNIGDLIPRMGRLDEALVGSALAQHASGIRVLAAPPPADLAHPISLPQVQQVLVWLRRMFAWVVVDLGLPMDETAFAFLDGADRIVVSVLPEMVGLRNTRLLLDQLLARGYPEEKMWLVLNRASMRNGVPVKDIEERLKVSIKYRIPDDQALATYSVNRGVPVAVSHRGSALARAFAGLARELAQDGAPEPDRAAIVRGTNSLLERWLRRPQTAGL